MAIICTNFLTGNDTTGDGSVSTPYKTIMFALGGATSSDEIRVAGGQWTLITGTVTFNAGSNIVNTSTDLTSVLAVKDVLTFEDSSLGFDKFHLIISAITSSTITLRGYWPGATITTSALYKINTYNYDFTATLQGVEKFNNALYLPNGRTGITISGGWDATYTSNANGWTVYRTTQAGSLFGGLVVPGMGEWNQNLTLDKFLIAGATTLQVNLFDGFTGATLPNGSSCALGKIAMTGNTIRLALGQQFTSLFGWWNPIGSESEMYLTQGALLSYNFVNTTEYTTNYPSVTFIPQKTEVNIWATPGNQNATPTPLQTTNILPIAFNTKLGGAQFICKNVHFRSTPLQNVAGSSAVNNNIQNSTGFIENLILYSDALPQVFRLSNGFQRFGLQVFNVGYTGAAAANSGIQYGFTSAQTLLEFTGQTVESTKPCFGSNVGATSGTLQFSTSLETIAQSYLSQTQVKDSEGLKTVDNLNNVYFKDDVNDWLRISAAKISAGTGQTGGFKSWAMLGVLDRPTTAFTVSVTLKVEGGEWDQIGVLYGPLSAQLITQSITPTSSFATYTLSVDPANYADWGSFIFPLYIGIRSTMPNLLYGEPDINCYVQSLSIV